jgi:asparagine synthase (glutamine-hydrolysing)
MIHVVRHRGPDGEGVYTNRNIGLAHARLSIVDPAAGNQPMHDGTGRLWITFNGEIFNHVELREELIRKGHRFRTRSDTEVILHQYQEKGIDCVNDFNGQWAFAIWDSETRKLFLSRDRFGIQPLFYTTHKKAFLFASEIKSLLACPGVPREIDRVGLDQIFTFWCTLPPRSIFQGIHELAPGHSLTVENGDIKTRRYWQIDFSGAFECPPPGPATEQAITERLLELLADSTRIRLRADVPVGAYLSGGLDSSVIAALMRQSSGAAMKTFSVAFEDPEFDESRHQEDMSRFLGVERQQIRCTNDDIGRVFPSVIWQTEKPILRTAPCPLYILSNLVRDSGHKVVLTGEGSDEMLGGYDIFKEAKIRRFWGAQPDSRVRPMLLGRLYPYQMNLQMQSPSYLQAFFRVNAGDLSNAFFSHLPRWKLTSRLKMFFSDEVQADTRQEDPYEALEASLPKEYSAWDPFCRGQYLETALLLPGYILSSQGDRMAMAHSVETRFPFLDHRVAEFAASIPPSLKMKVLNEKYILKRSAQDLIPNSIIRRTKQPYRAPEGKSFFTGGKARDYVESVLSPARIRKSGIFDSAAVQRLLAKFRDGMAIGIKDNMALTGIVSTQLVVDQFIERIGVRT